MTTGFVGLFDRRAGGYSAVAGAELGDRRGEGAMGPTALPILRAQATGSSPVPSSLARLALRRWFAGLMLSSAEPVPSFSNSAAAGRGTLRWLSMDWPPPWNR